MFKKISLLFFILIILFNKVILSKIILVNFQNILNKEISFEKMDVSYLKGSLTLSGLNVIEKIKSDHITLFFADEVYINFNLKSFFSTLIIIENINVINAKLKLNLKFSKDNKIVNDNIDILKNIKNENPKVYRTKLLDINFLILDSKIINPNIQIIKNNKEIIEIKLSNKYFKFFGNEKNFQHYKDIFKVILTETILKIPDQNLRNLIKETYKIR